MLLRTEQVNKQFNGIYALQGVNFELAAGEIHGLVGENGAGKSTLIKLLTGVYRLQEGQVLWDEQAVSITTPEESRRLGIHVIHQDRTLIPTFNGVENAYLGLEYPTHRGRIDWATMRRRVEETAARLGMELDLSKLARELSPPQKTCLEIVRAMMNDCRLLILDEPTASLTDREAELLFSILQTLRSKGTAILYVTHRLDEIFRLTDRVTVLRNGLLVDTVATQTVSREGLIAKMTDNMVVQEIPHSKSFGKVLLEVKDVASRDGRVQCGNLQARSGEILGVFGLGGSGRTELLECIYGCRRMAQGSITLDGVEQTIPSPSASLEGGMTLICEDRRGKAIIAGMSVRNNILLSSIDSFSKGGVPQVKDEDAAVNGQIKALQIKLAGLHQPMGELSGGNQQKAVFARALMTSPKVLLCDEPTQAVDVGTRNEIHRLLRAKADEGSAIVYVSSDLTELLEVADNIQVMSRGRTAQCWSNQNLTPQQVLSCCYEP